MKLIRIIVGGIGRSGHDAGRSRCVRPLGENFELASRRPLRPDPRSLAAARHQSQGLPKAASTSPCSRALSREKQQKMIRVNEGADGSAFTVVVIAILAARSAGN